MDETKDLLIKGYAALTRWNDALYPGSWPVIIAEIIATIVILLLVHRVALVAMKRVAARLPVSRRLLAYGSSSGRATMRQRACPTSCWR